MLSAFVVWRARCLARSVFDEPLLSVRLLARVYSTGAEKKQDTIQAAPALASPIMQFFENGEVLPDPSSSSKAIFGAIVVSLLITVGRAWLASELRLKGFEDLHKLWYVCLKELNMLRSQDEVARKLQTMWHGEGRMAKTRLTMRRIQQVLQERKRLYFEAVKLWRRQQQGLPVELTQRENDFDWACRVVDRHSKSFRSYRKMLRHNRKKHPRI